MVQPEVKDAIARGDPVVALETTIVTHGMPHPQNVQTALEVEQIIRDQGAVPASIGMLEGIIHVGKWSVVTPVGSCVSSQQTVNLGLPCLDIQGRGHSGEVSIAYVNK